MSYYILAPANIESGGPELCHQFCSSFNALSNNQCYIAYTSGFNNGFSIVNASCPNKFQKYNCESISSINSIFADNTSTIIFNEQQTNAMSLFKNSKKVIWWMSVDNYLPDMTDENTELIKTQADFHLVQSRYAYEFIKKTFSVPDDKIQFLGDYISEEYTKFILPGEYRKNRVVYNPKKGFQNIKKVIVANPNLEWFPLIDLTEKEMILNMQLAKVYIDFGYHPGKDRIPREAASCGCCVITNKEGSAAYYEDVPIDSMYKFDDINVQSEAINNLLSDICDNFEEHFNRFNDYRNSIKLEKDKFFSDVLLFANKTF